VARLVKALDEVRQEVAAALNRVTYFHAQVEWLHRRFPDAELCDVPGLVKAVGREEIEAADWSLTPGRYVGVAPEELDADFDFLGAMREIHDELRALDSEASGLAGLIQITLSQLVA
jgi:type I restriction enzyme M protein